MFDSDGVAFVSAFLSATFLMVFGGALYYGIKGQLNNLRNADRPMAVRNK